jgi:maltooligosyltrehalose trehalohydrolase
VPRLAGIAGHAGSAEVLGDGAVQVRWTLGDGSTLYLAANLNAAPLADIPSLAGRLLWQEGQSADGTLGPWSVAWSLDR